jgi:predicted nucleic acid-binding protein
MVSVNGKVLIDTNVLIYATLEGDHRCGASQKLLLDDRDDGVERFVSVQNLAEMYPNLTGSKMSFPDSPALARKKIESIASLSTIHVLPLTADIQRIALELCEKYNIRKQKYFDMQLVATMVVYGISTLFTENISDFTEFEELQIVNPFS